MSREEPNTAKAVRRFVGREAELAELEAAWAEAQAGRGRLYLLSGEPGIGKTRLADEISALAAARDAQVLWGRCWEAGGAPAYFPWLDVLSGLAEPLAGAALADAVGDGAAALLELLPSLKASLPGGRGALPSSPAEARFRLFRGVSALLKRAAAERAALIVLDDLHAADESSLLLLQFVARELRTTRALLLATFRDVEARLTPEVGEALGRLTREGTTLALSRLRRADAEQLVSARAGALDAAVHEQIWRRTQGNPLFLDEMARLLATQGSEALALSELPAGVREVIRQRLAHVPPAAHALLELAAVLGDEIDPGLLAQAAGAEHDTVASACAASLRAGLLVAREHGRFRYSHALVREVLERDLPPERKRELHAQAAAALEQRAAELAQPPLAELAHHLLQAPAAAIDRAVAYAERAAEHALSMFAFEDAIALLERARQAVEQAGGAPRLRAQVMIALARAHVRRGQGARGRELCLAAMQIGRGLADPELLAGAALAFGLELTPALIDQTLISLLQEALQALPAADSPLRVQVTARLGAALQPHPDPRYPIGLAQDAIASARRIGDPHTLLSAIYTGMAAMMDITDPRDRLQLNLEAEELAERMGQLEWLLRTQVRLTFDHMELGQLADADARIDRFERLARDCGAPRYLWRVPLFRSMRAQVHGRFGQARELTERARELGLQAEDPQLERCYVFHHEGLLRASEQHAAMRAYDPDARRMRAALYSGPHWQNGGSAFTFARVEDLERVRSYLELIPQDDWPLAHNPPAFMHLGEPLALLGERAMVERLYALLLPAGHRCLSWGWTAFLWEGTATRVLGLLAARLERWDEAAAHFDRAIEQLTAMDAGPCLARTRYEYGRALLARGLPEQRGAARALLEAAHTAAQTLAMSGLVDLAERRLEGVDSAPRAPVASAPPVPDAAPLPFRFTAEGEYWSVTHEGATFRLRDSLGLHYLARLFEQPGRALHALELSSGKPAGDTGDQPLDRGDAGELLDEQALASYRAKLASLREELAEAEGFADHARAERAREAIEFLSAEVSRAVGLGGRRRRVGGAGERARSAVQRRIRNTLERIREHSPALAGLLERSVKTGTFCVFQLDDKRS